MSKTVQSWSIQVCVYVRTMYDFAKMLWHVITLHVFRQFVQISSRLHWTVRPRSPYTICSCPLRSPEHGSPLVLASPLAALPPPTSSLIGRGLGDVYQGNAHPCALGVPGEGHRDRVITTIFADEKASVSLRQIFFVYFPIDIEELPLTVSKSADTCS